MPDGNGDIVDLALCRRIANGSVHITTLGQIHVAEKCIREHIRPAKVLAYLQASPLFDVSGTAPNYMISLATIGTELDQLVCGLIGSGSVHVDDLQAVIVDGRSVRDHVRPAELSAYLRGSPLYNVSSDGGLVSLTPSGVACTLRHPSVRSLLLEMFRSSADGPPALVEPYLQALGVVSVVAGQRKWDGERFRDVFLGAGGPAPATGLPVAGPARPCCPAPPTSVPRPAIASSPNASLVLAAQGRDLNTLFTHLAIGGDDDDDDDPTRGTSPTRDDDTRPCIPLCQRWRQ